MIGWVILATRDWDAWLETDVKAVGSLQDLLNPFPADAMEAWSVSTLVNSPKNVRYSVWSEFSSSMMVVFIVIGYITSGDDLLC